MPKGLNQTHAKGSGSCPTVLHRVKSVGGWQGSTQGSSWCFLKGQLPTPQTLHSPTDPLPERDGPGDRCKGAWGNPLLRDSIFSDTTRISEAPLSPSVHPVVNSDGIKWLLSSGCLPSPYSRGEQAPDSSGRLSQLSPAPHHRQEGDREPPACTPYPLKEGREL